MKRYLLCPQPDAAAEVRQETTEPPEPGPGEVRVSLAAASLNYRDLLMKSGQSASSSSASVVPLSDGAGTVDAVGDGVADWEVGDRVALTFFRDWESGRFDMKYHGAARGGSCDGVLSEQVVAPVRSLVAVPDYLTLEEAATLPCAGLTAWHSLMERGRPLEADQTVLVLGTGGVSIFALQIAKAVGARVIVTSSSDAKLLRAKELGADEGINYLEEPDWDKAVYRLTEKQGVDHVIEVGGPGTLPKSMNSVAAGGSIGLIGVLTGFEAPGESLFPLVARNVDLSGIYVGSREMFERFTRFLAHHEIRPVISDSFSFEEVPVAYRTLEEAGHFGKILVKF